MQQIFKPNTSHLFMQITDYYSEQQERFFFTRQQASDFAKHIAGDFNPIHDIDSKRFCVPGDLLFSVILARHGIHQNMRFVFSGMVSNDIPLHIDGDQNGTLNIHDDHQKSYLSVEYAGQQTNDSSLISQLTRNYVAFSGQTFPHILVPLMAEQNVMINPDRPMVIYESMSIDLDHLNLNKVTLQTSDSTLTVNGKRGSVQLHFDLIDNDTIIGRGEKHMVLSGLRAFDQQIMDALVNDYDRNKASYQQSATG